jgi:uncharacterized protein YdaU (DUF1376 family)
MNPMIRSGATKAAYFAAVIGAFLIVLFLVLAMRHFTQPAPLGEDRAAARTKALAELRAAENEALHTTAWIDQGKGIVRLRIDDAIKMIERDWSRDGAAARSNLMQRVAKATAIPPKAPAKPSEFE